MAMWVMWEFYDYKVMNFEVTSCWLLPPMTTLCVRELFRLFYCSTQTLQSKNKNIWSGDSHFQMEYFFILFL